MKCKKCGIEVENNSKFCPECGIPQDVGAAKTVTNTIVGIIG